MGCLPQFFKDQLGFLLETARTYGPVARVPILHSVIHLVADPAGVKQVLQERSDRYGRATPAHVALRATLGRGIITSDGEFWRRQRRLTQPAFHKERLAAFATTIGAAAEAGTRALRRRAEGGETVDLMPEIVGITLQSLLQAMFGPDWTGPADEIAHALGVTVQHTLARPWSILPGLIPTPGNLRFKAALRTIDRVVVGTIAKRRGAPGDRGDILSMLLEARDQATGEGMDDRQLRDEVVTLLFGGHETTPTALAWTFHLLASHPPVRQRLEQELDAVLGTRPVGLEDLPHLRYTRMVFEEAMRLYPPAWVVTRSVKTEDEIAGFQIPAGSFVWVSPYVTHRDPQLWQDPETFDPERFADYNETDIAGRPRYAYFPFGGGPHLCIGKPLAIMQALIVVATIAREVRLDLVPGHPVTPVPLINLHPKHGILVTPHIRDPKSDLDRDLDLGPTVGNLQVLRS